MNPILELDNLAPEPVEEWQRMLRFSNLDKDDRDGMTRSVEALLRRSSELVIGTYDYLRSVPETASILGWEDGIDPIHLEERRRFFTVWLARTLGMDTSDEFAMYLFRAGQYHAGYGPRHIHTPSAYVTASIGLVQSAFSRFLAEASLPGNLIAQAMSGWSKYLSLQLNQMIFGYQIARDYAIGEMDIRCTLYGKMRPLIGKTSLDIPANDGDPVADILSKFFNFYPQARSVALDRVWRSHENVDSLWTEISPVYKPRTGWRILLNGRDLNYEEGFTHPVRQSDKLAIFPPGR